MFLVQFGEAGVRTLFTSLALNLFFVYSAVSVIQYNLHILVSHLDYLIDSF